ncbi:hypothetical protein Taro_025491, partial [Colocasia esculenta]|nr:hypothetical protein [Colocasia esculenta]
RYSSAGLLRTLASIWCVDHNRAPVLGGASVGGFCSRHQLLVLLLSLLCVSLHLLNLEDQVPVGAASVSPPLATCSGQSTHSPDIVVGSVPEDVVSLQEGGGSFYESTLREVWINGDKIEPAQASQFITRTIQAHFLGPIHRFNDFPMEVQELYQMFMSNHRFMCRSDEARCRSVWTMTARSNFKHLLYNMRKNTEKVSQSADPTLWRERAPSWMRKDY